jgi:hypothetical protein
MQINAEAIDEIATRLGFATFSEFGSIEKALLKMSFNKCGMIDYPPVIIGDPFGERVCGDQICDRCGNDYYSHPMDWRLIGYGNVPFLNVLCDGRRVKL